MPVSMSAEEAAEAISTHLTKPNPIIHPHNVAA